MPSWNFSKRYRVGVWMRQTDDEGAGNRLLVFVPMTADEIAAALSVGVDQAETVLADHPGYFLVGNRRWITPN